MNMPINPVNKANDLSAFTNLKKMEKDEGLSPLSEPMDQSSIGRDSNVQKKENPLPLNNPSDNKVAEPVDYHFKPAFLVEKTLSGWVMHLPNAKIPLPGKPQWLKTYDVMNDILDKSANPLQVKNTVDNISRIATESYDAVKTYFDRDKLKTYLGNIDNKDILTPALLIFKEMLNNEAMSTDMYGGSMAASRCSEMFKLKNAVDLLNERINGI
jgi:hypothetical protein